MNIENITTPINYLGDEIGNKLFIKREDLIPYSFGGNKARKAQLFFEDIQQGDCDCIVTYGSSSSNHCRVISNIACSKNLPCYIISPQEVSIPTYNSKMMKLFGAEIVTVPVNEVHATIENKLFELKRNGKLPYFIPGGGHGNLGTHAYVNCYNEIKHFEDKYGIHFDYIFHASGTGTTQAGLVCGQVIHKDKRKIVGISIARKLPRGRDVILESIYDYLTTKGISFARAEVESATVFIDSFTGVGYGSKTSDQTIEYALKKYGIPLDGTYTGKAFDGMLKLIQTEDIVDSNILFIHTGGTPLFFDYLQRLNI